MISLFRSRQVRALLPVTVFVLALCAVVSAAAAEPWKFGIISDTQWTIADDGKNPNTCAVDIINQVNEQFIKERVKLVVQVGDLCNSTTDPVTHTYGNAPEDTRATFAQALYNAGIAFYPLRGNHDSAYQAAGEFVRIYPQTQTGLNNNTPADALLYTDDYGAPPKVKGHPFVLGANFSSPNDDMKGLTYSFDYKNARFVLIDQFGSPDGTAYTTDSQQPWITGRLAARPVATHAFVFSHKGLITEDHADNLFGSNPASDPEGTDAFIRSLAYNNARYLFLGHDHMHDLSIVRTTLGLVDPAHVTQVVTASDSSKFYTPAIPSNDERYNVPAGYLNRRTPVAQELETIGYYIVTVDGAKVTVDFYSAEVASPFTTTGDLHFTLRQSFGYSLLGKEFLVAQGESYDKVADGFAGTTAAIIGGSNTSTEKDGSNRPLSKQINTGWSMRNVHTISNILTLWGIAGLGTAPTSDDVYTLSISYDERAEWRMPLRQGRIGIATQDERGKWVNAAEKTGGAASFVYGPWQPGYGLGTYGVDTATNTAWAVVNYDGDFAVARFMSSH